MTMHATLGDKTVTVQVLRVDGKKMTLQLFKQIPVVGTDEDAPTYVTAWGRVLYSLPVQGDVWVVGDFHGEFVKFRLDYPESTERLTKELERWRREVREMEAGTRSSTLLDLNLGWIAQREKRLEVRAVEDAKRAPFRMLSQLYLI